MPHHHCDVQKCRGAFHSRPVIMHVPLAVALLLANVLYAQEVVDEKHLLSFCRNRHDHPLCLDVSPVQDDFIDVDMDAMPLETVTTLSADLQLGRAHMLPAKRKASFIRFGKRLNEQVEKRKASFIRLG